MTKIPKIEVVVSTLNDAILNIQFSREFNYLVVHQVADLINKDKYDAYIDNLKKNDIRYIRSYEIGLSKSRNLGLEHAIGDYIWIMDDDVEIFSDTSDRLIDYIDSYPSNDILVLNYSSDKHQRYSNKKEQLLGYITVASVCSINMLIKKSSIENIQFDEKFGLGTKFPSGEEYIFCCDMLRAHKKIWQTDLVVSYHSPADSGQDFYSTPYKLAAKKRMFIRAHGVVAGMVLYLLFLMKKLPILLRNKAFFNIIESFWK